MKNTSLKKSLTILQVATIDKPISKKLGYSPLETVVSDIDTGLIELGHKSIVAGSSDSEVRGSLYPTIEKSFGDYLSYDNHTKDQRKTYQEHLAKSLARAKKGDIDLVHVHISEMAQYFFNGKSKIKVPIVMTLHTPPRDSKIEEYKLDTRISSSSESPVKSSIHFVPISLYQKHQYYGIVPTTRYVYHGIDLEKYNCKTKIKNQSYYFCIGRISPVKGQDRAIEFAKKTGSQLILAGPVQSKESDINFYNKIASSIDLSIDLKNKKVTKDYFSTVMKPILQSGKKIIYLGELDSEQKKQWYYHAIATLFPIRWGEPFGLVLIESLACGTPVLAIRGGAVPEIMLDKKTGFVVSSIDEMVRASKWLSKIDPQVCRSHIMKHFSVHKMVENYLSIYNQILHL